MTALFKVRCTNLAYCEWWRINMCRRKQCSLNVIFCRASIMNKYMFSYLRTLTAWHCPHSTAAHRCCSNRSISSACRARSSKSGFAAVGPCWDRRISYSFYACSAYKKGVPYPTRSVGGVLIPLSLAVSP